MLRIVDRGSKHLSLTAVSKISKIAFIALALVLLAGTADSVWSQNGITTDDYLSFMPLEYPKVVRQTEASAELHLYGNVNDPGYSDVDPVDGVDDTRMRILQQMALRFAPYMVQNTIDVPMDFKKFMNGRQAFLLYIDTWDISGSEDEIVQKQTIDFTSLGQSNCKEEHDPSDNEESNDCKVLTLIKEFHPESPQYQAFNTASLEANRKRFKAMYFNMLRGKTPEQWRKFFIDEYSEVLATKYENYVKTYVHPFIDAHYSKDTNERLGYELVLQYWFFYPTNDGGNNHEGDWEHLNVIVSPKDRVEQLLTAEDIQEVLDGKFLTEPEEPNALVIKRLVYYFHHFAMELDFSSPNVYKSREAWNEDIHRRVIDRAGLKKIWGQIRYLAYLDKKETRINTHPFCYIGADNKGLDQALVFPGGKNRDSHGTYPFPGLYKDIGPAGASEQISLSRDPRDYIDKEPSKKQPEYKRGNVVGFDHPDRIEIVPDWERIIDLVEDNPEVRRNWSWMLLPIRWGFPAVPSPFAGVVKHADTGNLAPVGPSFSSGWNQASATRGFDLYEPHRLSSAFPLGVVDSFDNSWGFLNLTLPLLSNVPPFDFVWRIAAYPFRRLLGESNPVYYPKAAVPFRFFGLTTGYSTQNLDNRFNDLLFSDQAHLDELLARLGQHIVTSGGDSTTRASTESSVGNAVSPMFEFVFHIGNRFTSENMIRNSHTGMVQSAEFTNIPPFTITSELNMWEYAGSFKYSLTTSRFQPYLKAGYGLTWYRVENIESNGEPFDNPDTDWIRKPSVFPFKNLLPNTWHIGGGFEVIAYKSFAPFPKGLDFSVRAEYVWFFHDLGLDISDLDLALLGLTYDKVGDLPQSGMIARGNFNLVMEVGW